MVRSAIARFALVVIAFAGCTADEDAEDLWVGRWEGTISRSDGTTESFSMEIATAEFLRAEGQVEQYRFDGTLTHPACNETGASVSLRGAHHQDRSTVPFTDTFLFVAEGCQAPDGDVFGGNTIEDQQMSGRVGNASIGCTGTSICGAPFEDFGCLYLCPGPTFTASRE